MNLALPHTIVTADTVNSGGGDRRRQEILDKALRAVLSEAVEAGSFATGLVLDRPDGDSATLVFAPDVPKARIVADFAQRELALALALVNDAAAPRYRLRLRVAIGHGEIVLHPPHVSGNAVLEAARLRDAPALRAAMDDHPGADLGLIVTDAVFRDVVERGERGLDAGGFREVPVRVKNFTGTGWIHVPAGRAAAAPEPPGGPGAEVVYHVGTLNARDSVFGVVKHLGRG
ncbi:hypothetical protein [Amycolatopsis sp. MEPSY49]|uniref:hypothetical protein n=1 Tax=Amycolatopsis sp. MEPSY49 TaxID=3151600 RepID=UPI003EF9390F